MDSPGQVELLARVLTKWLRCQLSEFCYRVWFEIFFISPKSAQNGSDFFNVMYAFLSRA